jgi:hypothetical protein
MYLKKNKMQDTYAIIDINDLLKVDFRQVGQTSAETVRKSLDGYMFVLKWEETPTFITNGSIIPLQLLTHSECIDLMNTPEWSETI